MNAPAKSLLDGAEVMAFDPNEIDTSGRIGFYHPDKAVAVGRLLYKDGQRDLIKVAASKKPGFRWRLLVGLHRTEGAKLEGLPVYGVVVSGKPEILRELEASENIHRRPLLPIEHAKFVFELCRAAQERIAREHGNLSQQQLGAKARWDRQKHWEITADQALQEETDDAADKMSAAYGWQDSVAEALDLGKRQIRRCLAIYRLVVEPFPELAEALEKHPVVGGNASQLLKIANQGDEAVRRRVVEALIRDETLNADAAILQFGETARSAAKEPLDPTRKHKDAIRNNWDRLAHRKMQFIPTFASWLTRPQALAMQDAVAQRLSELGDGDE